MTLKNILSLIADDTFVTIYNADGYTLFNGKKGTINMVNRIVERYDFEVDLVQGRKCTVEIFV